MGAEMGADKNNPVVIKQISEVKLISKKVF